MLGVILGYADLALRRLSVADPLTKTLAGIKAAAERSADLTRRLLAFSRRQTIAPRVLDLSSQLQGMESLLRRIIGEDVELVFRLAHGGWPVSIDPSQLDQVLANLAVNARDAMPEGGRLAVATENVSLDEAYCRTHAEAIPGEYVCLSVSDDGCGMDAATLSRVFEPFFTTKPEGKGTGLGLAMLYGIVRQNGGHVSAYSEPGGGTTFRIYLPRHQGAVGSVEPAEPPERLRRGQETILLVEDEESLRELSRELLGELGYQVLAAAGPGEALALCEKHPGAIDLLLTDVVMPVMGGKELAARVAALRPGIKVLFSSGYTADAIAHQGVLEAGVHLLEKPFVLATLARKVAEVLGAEPKPRP
jgi:two-component system, cell cycle sensor histidine kinase and response regulator CckA